MTSLVNVTHLPVDGMGQNVSEWCNVKDKNSELNTRFNKKSCSILRTGAVSRTS